MSKNSSCDSSGMKELIAIIIPSIFLFIYLLFSSLQFGSSFFLLFPKLVSKQKLVERYLRPSWELTNLFLLFFIASIYISFPESVYSSLTAIFTSLAVAVFFYGIRLLCILLLYYSKSNDKSILLLLVIASFLSPMLFSNSLTFAFTGSAENIFFSPISIALYFTVIFTILTISSSFFLYHEKSHADTVRLNSFSSFSLLALLITLSVLVMLLVTTVPHLFANSIIPMLLAILSGVTLALFSAGYLLKEYMLRFIAVCLFVGVVFFSLLFMQLPYIIYPTITIINSFAGNGIFTLLLASYGIGAIIIIPTLILLFSLFLKQKDV